MGGSCRASAGSAREKAALLPAMKINVLEKKKKRSNSIVWRGKAAFPSVQSVRGNSSLGFSEARSGRGCSPSPLTFLIPVRSEKGKKGGGGLNLQAD